MAAPTFVAEYEAAWNTASTPKTVSVTAQAGDVLVVFASTIDTSDVPAPTGGTGITWTIHQTVAATDFVRSRIYSAIVPSNQTFNLSINFTGGEIWGYNVLQFRNSDGVGASAKANAEGAPSVNITTTGANSAIVVHVADFNEMTGTRTWRTVNSITPSANNGLEVTYAAVDEAYVVYGAYYSDAGAAGSKTVGLSAPTGQQYSIVALEVLGAEEAAEPVLGEAAASLGGLTATALGTRIVTGAAQTALGGLTGTALGDHKVNGVAAATAALTASATGQVLVTGNASTSMALAATATGQVIVNGSGSTDFGSLTASAAGHRTRHGEAQAILGELLGEAMGMVQGRAHAMANLKKLIATGFGVRRTTGSGAATLGINATTSGVVGHTGSAAALLGALTGSASGTASGVVSAVAALGGLDATGIGFYRTYGVAVANLGGLSAHVSGEFELSEPTYEYITFGDTEAAIVDILTNHTPELDLADGRPRVSTNFIGYEYGMRWITVSQEGGFVRWPNINRPRIDIQVLAERRSVAHDIADICLASIRRWMGRYRGYGLVLTDAIVELGLTRVPDRRQEADRYIFALRLTTRPDDSIPYT